MLPLPATCADVLAQVIVPTFDYLPQKMRSPQACLMLMAIGKQESGFATREQVNGPARGLWQFERNGVLAVMHNTASAADAYALCQQLDITWGSNSILNALDQDDILACGLARLLLWCDPRPLPEVGDVMGAYGNYERGWRPGKPSYSRWKQDAYPAALAAVTA